MDAVIYYSRTGSTKEVADVIAKEKQAKTIEIKDKSNREGGLNYIKSCIDSVFNRKTNIEPSTVDIGDFDTIYIGSPVWASKPTPAIIEFLNNMDFTDKNVITFATMMGSGATKTTDAMNKIIQSKGGNVKSSFYVTTGNASSIEEKTLEEIKNL